MANEGFVRANPESAEVVRPDFRGGRQYRIDLGRVMLVESHRILRRAGADPEVRESYEKSFTELRKILDDFEFEEAQSQAYELLLNDKEN